MAEEHISAPSTTAVDSVWKPAGGANAPSSYEKVGECRVTIEEGAGKVDIAVKPVDCSGGLDVRVRINGVVVGTGSINSPAGDSYTITGHILDPKKPTSVGLEWKGAAGSGIDAGGSLVLNVGARDWSD